MTPEEFTLLVAKDVRHGCSEDEVVILESDIRSWIKNLNTLKRDVEVQLAAQKARMTQTQVDMLDDPTKGRIDWLNFKSAEDRWRVGALRFMVSVEERIAHAKNIRASRNEKVMTV